MLVKVLNEKPEKAAAVGVFVTANQPFPRINVKVGDRGKIVKDCGTGHYEIRFATEGMEYADIVLHRTMFDDSNIPA